MKKFKLLAISLTAFLSIFCSVQASENSVTPYRLVNIEQYGHSDGYREEGWGPFKTKVFVGTNIYKAQMEVKNNNKNVLINVTYAISEHNEKAGLENKENPLKIIIGEEIVSNSPNFEERFVKNTSLREIQKVESIGLSKEEFDKTLKTHFSNVHYI